jgi:hypothetical protein
LDRGDRFFFWIVDDIATITHMPPQIPFEVQVLAKLDDIQKTLKELFDKLEKIENNQSPLS